LLPFKEMTSYVLVLCIAWREEMREVRPAAWKSVRPVKNHRNREHLILKSMSGACQDF
jgi:hypothetical protein